MTRHGDTGAGFTLIELMIGLVSSSMLVAGLASAIYISSQALDLDSSTSRQSAIASEVLGKLTADLALARSFSERTATAVTFDVPDRDGDLHPETIRYAWSGTPGDPLTYQYNGGTETTIATDVQSFDLSALTRLMIAPVIEVEPLSSIVFEEFTEAKLSSNGLALAVPVPPGTVAGDLLIVAMALDGNPDALAPPAGWNLLVLEEIASRVRLGVWWKIATAAEGSSYNFTWISKQQAYGWVMRFTGHDPAMPINSFAFNMGSSSTPTTPTVATTVDNTMILRIGAFDDDDITVDVSGMSGHTTITMDESSSSPGSSSGGAAYAYQGWADATDTADFTLIKNRNFVTTTIAIAPEPSP